MSQKRETSEVLYNREEWSKRDSRDLHVYDSYIFDTIIMMVAVVMI